MDQLDMLQKRLDKTQQAILNSVWDYHCEHNKWIPTRVLHHKFGKPVVLNAFQGISDDVVQKFQDNWKEFYRLTFLGILLTCDGKEWEKIITRYLGYVRELFMLNPEIEKIDSRDVESTLYLSADQSRILYNLLIVSNLHGGSAVCGSEGWSVGVPNDIDDLPQIENLQDYVRMRAFEYCSDSDVAEGSKYEYDVALSFAGEDRDFVEKVAEKLGQNKIRVFYDRDRSVALWGKDLGDALDDVYRLRSKCVVMFISKHYAEKRWTNHERKSAFSRAIQEKQEYVLPARFDQTELTGLRPTIAYIDLRRHTSDSFAELIMEKLKELDRSSS